MAARDGRQQHASQESPDTSHLQGIGPLPAVPPSAAGALRRPRQGAEPTAPDPAGQGSSRGGSAGDRPTPRGRDTLSVPRVPGESVQDGTVPDGIAPEHVHAEDPRTSALAYVTEAAPRVSLLRQVAAAQVPSVQEAQAVLEQAEQEQAEQEQRTQEGAAIEPGTATLAEVARSAQEAAQRHAQEREAKEREAKEREAQRRQAEHLQAEQLQAAQRRGEQRASAPGARGAGPGHAASGSVPSTPVPAATTAVPKADPAPSDAPTGQEDSPYALHTDRGRTAVPQAAHPAARKLLARMLEDEAPPTTTFNIVDRLVGSPYASAVRSRRAKPSTDVTADVARPVLLFTLDLAETMFRWGAGALDVESSVIAVTTSLGLRHVDVDVTNQSVHLNWAPPEAMPVSILRVVRSSSDNFAGLSLVHQLVGDIAAGRADFDEARTRLRSIRRRHKPYSKALVVGAGGLFAGLFVLVIGGSFVGALAAVVPAIIAELLVRLTERWRVPAFFCMAAATIVSTLLALLLFAVGVVDDPAIVVAGGIMLLLPSGRFVSAVQDAINGFPVTAVGRLFSALIVYAGIISGVMLGAVIAVWVGLPSLTAEDLTRAPNGSTLPLWLLCVLIALAVACGGMVQQVARRHLWLISAIAVVGYLVSWVAVQYFHAGSRLAPALAATAMGLLARWIGLRVVGTPPLVLAVPAIVILLPGLAIFRSMYSMALDASDVTSGLVGMFTSFTVIMGIAAGVALGDTLARPFTRDWNSRKRIRRR